MSSGTNTLPSEEQSNESVGECVHSTQQLAEQPLRVGLLLPGEAISTWMKRAIERMISETNVEITHLVVNSDGGPGNLNEYLTGQFPGGVLDYASCCVDRLRTNALWSLTGIARQLSPTPDYRKPVPIDSIADFSTAKRISCRPVPASGFGNRLPDEVATEVGENTDVVIRFGFGVLKGEFLSMPTHGVLSFHRGDLESYRGQPGGFWEFLNGEPTAGVTLQRISETLDGGEIVAEETVDITDAHTWREVERRQIVTCERLLEEGIRRLRDSTVESTTPDSLGELYTIPMGMDVVRYVVKTAVGLVHKYSQTRLTNDSRSNASAR